MLNEDNRASLNNPNRQIVATAKEFRIASRVLFDRICDHDPGDCVLPVYMNAAFAIELYLKSMNAVEKTAPSKPGPPEFAGLAAEANARDHRLANLFDALPREARQQLEQRYLAKSVNTHFPRVEDAFRYYSTTFVDSRYAFERERPEVGDLHLLVHLAELIGEFVEDPPTPETERAKQAARAEWDALMGDLTRQCSGEDPNGK